MACVDGEIADLKAEVLQYINPNNHCIIGDARCLFIAPGGQGAVLKGRKLDCKSITV